jgi:hypothetical protein
VDRKSLGTAELHDILQFISYVTENSMSTKDYFPGGKRPGHGADYTYIKYQSFFNLRAPQQMLRTHRSLECLLCNPVMKMKRFFLLLHCNGAQVE